MYYLVNYQTNILQYLFQLFFTTKNPLLNFSTVYFQNKFIFLYFYATNQTVMARPKNIESPEEFLELFYEFKNWKLSQVIKVPTVSKTGQIELECTPPLTWAGFDAWLFEKKIINCTDEYRIDRSGTYKEFSSVIRAINSIMYANKFEGAAVGAFNANIISRDLGLADRQQIEAPQKEEITVNVNF